MHGIRDILFDFLRQYTIIIYGCGNQGKFLQWLLSENSIQPAFWCDKNQDLWNKNINNIKCISPEELGSVSNAVIILSMMRYQEVLPTLKENQFKKILTWDDMSFLESTLQADPVLWKKYQKHLLQNMPELAIELKKNERFRNIHSGKRCFIIGNGPSVKNQNLAFLNNEITFTVNQIARNPQFEFLNTNYHIWADPGFFKTEFTCEGDYELLEIMKKTTGKTECFFPYNKAHNYIEKYNLDKYIRVNYYMAAPVSIEEDVDFTQFVRGGYTVIQYALRLAFYMGFTEIYLLGCECTTILNVINARTSHYASITHCYEIDNLERQRAKTMYFSRPMYVYYESERGGMEEYHLIAQECKKRGIKVVNCTPGGLLDEFQRMDYEKVIDVNNGIVRER